MIRHGIISVLPLPSMGPEHAPAQCGLEGWRSRLWVGGGEAPEGEKGARGWGGVGWGAPGGGEVVMQRGGRVGASVGCLPLNQAAA